MTGPFTERSSRPCQGSSTHRARRFTKLVWTQAHWPPGGVPDDMTAYPHLFEAAPTKVRNSQYAAKRIPHGIRLEDNEVGTAQALKELAALAE
jgi:hypothetical protein